MYVTRLLARKSVGPNQVVACAHNEIAKSTEIFYVDMYYSYALLFEELI